MSFINIVIIIIILILCYKKKKKKKNKNIHYYNKITLIGTPAFFSQKM